LNFWAIIPFKQLVEVASEGMFSNSQYFYLTKVVRLYHGFIFLDSKEFVK